MSIYIQSAKQISVQKPLTDEWFDSPVYYTDKRVATQDPDFTKYLTPLMARRMCKLIKRDVILSRLVLKDVGVKMPDAIISGTGLGCINNTEKFILSIMENNEQCLQPSFFMQSTHNVLSSTIAIELKCHGYNNTFVHQGVSFDNALLDAILQFREHGIHTALVGGYDELTDNYYTFFKHTGTWNFEEGEQPKGHCFASETAMSMLLGSERTEGSICKINDAAMMYRPTTEQMRRTLDRMLSDAGCNLSDIDAVMTGINTNPVNDSVYHEATKQIFGDIPVMQYKHIFGESFSSSAMGVYAAAICLHKRLIPAFLLADRDTDINNPKHILIYNHYRNKSHSLILLSSC